MPEAPDSAGARPRVLQMRLVVETPDSAHDLAVERIIAALKAWLS